MDPYLSPDSQSDETIEAMVERLESRGEDPRFSGYIDDYLSQLELNCGQTVLDVGCGTGVVARRLMDAAPEDVKVIGLDISEKFLASAKRLAGDKPIEWIQGSGHSMPFDDESIDVAVLHTLLSHVPDTVGLLKEVRRVVKPSGTVIIFDADYASTTYGFSDFEKGREYDIKLLSAIVSNIDACRQLPRNLKEAGLKLISHKAHVLSEAGKGDFWLSSVQAWAKLIPSLEILPKEEGEAWVNTMLKSHEDGTFFASGNFYTFWVEKRE